MNDTEHLRLFKEVVLCGVACGLSTPQEWVVNYTRCLMNFYPYDRIPEIEKQLYRIAVDLYKTTLLQSKDHEPSQEEVSKWINNFYER